DASHADDHHGPKELTIGIARRRRAAESLVARDSAGDAEAEPCDRDAAEDCDDAGYHSARRRWLHVHRDVRIRIGIERERLRRLQAAPGHAVLTGKRDIDVAGRFA